MELTKWGDSKTKIRDDYKIPEKSCIVEDIEEGIHKKRKEGY